MAAPVIRPFRRADTDWLVAAHQRLYSAEEGFDDTFGPLVRTIVEDFTAGHDPRCEAGWIAEVDGTRAGSIFVMRHDAQLAKLRLFLLEPPARGRGLGQRLHDTCIGFARGAGYAGMTLWTHESHRAACALYARNGWQLARSRPVISFGQALVEQTWTRDFAAG